MQRLVIILLLANVGLFAQGVVPPVPATPLQVVKMQNITNGVVIDNRSTFQALNNGIGFCAKGSGFWQVDLQFSDAAATGPWTTPGGTATVTNYNSTCVGFFLGFHSWYRFNVTGTGQAVVSYSAVKDFWMPGMVGSVTTYPYILPYVVNATTSPQTIPQSIHGQGPNTGVDCWSGPLTVDLHIQGSKVLCYAANDGEGNLTVEWFTGTVGSIIVYAAGPGPPGPSGIGANPFVIAATTSPQTITQTVHGQGFNVDVQCFSGPLVNAHVTGTLYPCEVVMDSSGNGNATVSWTGSAVQSIMISASGRPAPYTANVSTSPVTVLQTTHSQGFSPNASCWSGPVIAFKTTGHSVLCDIQKNTTGDVTFSFGGTSVQSIQIQ